MIRLKSRQFRLETQEVFLEELEKYPLWSMQLEGNLPGMKDLRRKVKSKYKSIVISKKEKNIMSLPEGEQTMVFNDMEGVKGTLKELGEALLCNVEVNGEQIFHDFHNLMDMAHTITNEEIKLKHFHQTIFGAVADVNKDLGLSSDEEEEEGNLKIDLQQVPQFKSSLELNDENTTPFTPSKIKEEEEEEKEVKKTSFSLDDFTQENTKIKTDSPCCSKEEEEEEEEEQEKTTGECISKERKKSHSKKNMKRKNTAHKKTSEKKKRKIEEEEEGEQQEQVSDLMKIITNMSEMEMKESDMKLLAAHLDKSTVKSVKSTLDVMGENIPVIHDTFKIILKFALTLQKMLKRIPYKYDESTGEPIIQCSGCHLHCVGNWNLPNPSGRPVKQIEEISKK